MAVSTVTQRQRRVSDAEVNSRSGFLQTLFGKNTAQPEPDEPNAQSLWLFERIGKDLRGELDKLANYLAAKVRENHTAAYGENRQVGPFNTHPKPLLRAITNRAVDLESDPLAGARYSVQVLLPLWEQLLAEAAEEGQAQDRFERRTLANQQAVATKARRLEVAASDEDEDAHLKTATVVTANGEEKEYLPGTASKIVANALRASDPEPTALQMALTPDVLERMDAERAAQTAVLPQVEVTVVPALASSNPAAAPQDSPLHVADGTTPPIPTEDEVADPGAAKPLPKRIPYGSSAEVVERTTEAGEAS